MKGFCSAGSRIGYSYELKLELFEIWTYYSNFIDTLEAKYYILYIKIFYLLEFLKSA